MQKKRALQAAGALLAAAAALAGIYLLRPPCLILEHTGLYCAGCGTQRMVTALLRGDIPGAFACNPFMFVCLPLACLYALWEARRYAQGKSPLFRARPVQAAFAAVLLAGAAFMALRNLM